MDRARLLREMFAVLQPPEARDLAVRLARVRESLETLRANVGSLKDREAVAEMERTVASAEAEYARRFGDLERLARKLAAASNPRD